MLRRGVSHIEMILAFVIFVGFLIFALFFFNPLNNVRVLDSSLEYSFNEIFDNVAVDFETYTVSLNGVPNGVVELTLDSDISSAEVRIEDENGNILNSEYDGTNVRFEKNGESVAHIMFSEVFVASSAPTGVSNSIDEGMISSSEEKKVFSEERVEALVLSYNSDYDTVKSNFNLPGRVDFAFSLIFDEGDSLSAEREIPNAIDVYSESERVEVIRKDGSLDFADFLVKVW